MSVADSGGGTDNLASRLRALITANYRAGDRLPSEPKLAAAQGVSRSSIREALKALEQDGLLHSVRGRGRFVSPLGVISVERPITRYESTTQMLQSLGFTVVTLVLDAREAAAGARAAELLGIAPGSPVIELTRLRVWQDSPLVVSRNVIVRGVLPGPVTLRDWSRSLTDTLATHGARLVSSAARITAARLPAELASHPSLANLDPWLLIEETSFTSTGQPVLYSLDYHRGDQIGFNVLRS